MNGGDRVIVSSPSGSVECIIERVSTVQDLAELPGRASELVALLAGDGSFRKIALLSHRYAYGSEFLPGRFYFSALEDSAGRWWDLAGRPLDISPAPSRPVLQPRLRLHHGRRR